MLESLEKSVSGTGDAFDKQLAKMQQWADAVQKLESELDGFRQSREKYSSQSREQIDLDNAAMAEQEERIRKARDLQKRGKQDILRANAERFKERTANLMQEMMGKTEKPEDRIHRTVGQYKTRIEQSLAELDEARQKGVISKRAYSARKKELQDAATYANTDMRNDLLADHYAQEELRIARAKRQDVRLKAQSDKMLRDEQGDRRESTYSQLEMRRDHRIDQYDQLIASHNVAISSRRKELRGIKKGSDNYAALENEIAELEARRDRLKAAQQGLDGNAGAIKDISAYSSNLQKSLQLSNVDSGAVA